VAAEDNSTLRRTAGGPPSIREILAVVGVQSEYRRRVALPYQLNDRETP
jgi:hypothetical protein